MLPAQAWPRSSWIAQKPPVSVKDYKTFLINAENICQKHDSVTCIRPADNIVINAVHGTCHLNAISTVNHVQRNLCCEHLSIAMTINIICRLNSKFYTSKLRDSVGRSTACDQPFPAFDGY